MPEQLEQQNGYVDSPEFKELFVRSLKNPDSLSAGEAKRVETAIELFPHLREAQRAVQGPEKATISPEAQKAQELYVSLGEKMLSSVMSLSSNGSNGDSKRRQAIFRTGQRFKAMAENLPDIIVSAEADNGNIQQTVRKAVLAPIRRTQEDFHSAQNGDKPIQVPKSDSEIKAGRMVNTAIELAPETLLAPLRDPTDLLSSFGDWPMNEATIVMAASEGKHLAVEGDNQLMWKSLSDQKINEAIRKVVESKNGILALGLMAITGIGREDLTITPIEADRFRGLLSELDKILTRVRDLEIEIAIANSAESDETQDVESEGSPVTKDEASFLSGLVNKLSNIFKSETTTGDSGG